MPFSGSGSGTVGNPYQVTTLAQVYEVFDDLAANYLQMNDIDGSETASGNDTLNYNGPKGWVPLDASTFSGVYDGGGFSITNMYCNVSEFTSEGGLFYIVTGEVKNITIEWDFDSDDTSGPTFKSHSGVCFRASGSASFTDINTKVFCTNGDYIFKVAGIVNDIQSGGVSLLRCFTNVNITTSNGRVASIGGIANTAREYNMTDCGSQLSVVAESPSITCNTIGGLVALSYSNNAPQPTITECKVNIFVDVSNNGSYIGGIIGNTQNGLAYTRIQRSWAFGKIIGKSILGGICGSASELQGFDNWSKVDITSNDATDTKSGLLAGLAASASETFLQRFLNYGSLTITNQPSASYSADVIESAGSFVDIIHNSELKGDIDGGAGDETNGTGLTTAQLKDETYLDANTGLNFSTTWETGGYDGYMDLIENPYDGAFIIYTGDVIVINQIVSSEHVDADSGKIISQVTGIDESTATAKGFEVGNSEENLTQDIPISVGNTFEATLDNLDELDIKYYRSYITYQGETFYSNIESYTHYTLTQLGIDNIVVDDYIPSFPRGHNIHGSALLDIGGTEYVFGSSREQGINNTENDVNAVFVKVQASDYTNKIEMDLLDEEGQKCHDFNQLVFCNGFLWTIGRTGITAGSGANQYAYLFRIDPDSLEYVGFKNTPGAIALLSTDSHGTDGERFLFTGATDVGKIDTDELIGVYANRTYTDFTVASVDFPIYDSSSQGYFLDPRSPNSFNTITKGFIHSYVVDGEFLYLEYTSSSNFNQDEQESECELHKVRISDMTAAGYARIPKCTDDATQNAEWIFLGIETGITHDVNDQRSKNMGYDWGCAAVRKSDMALFVIPRLHSTDEKGTSSYASTVFGDFLIDQKTTRYSYVLDISDPSSWTEIDQFADAGSWIINDTIGSHTLKVFRLYEDYTDENDNTLTSGIPNEIMVDSQNNFHSFGWNGSPSGSPSSLSRYTIEGISFIGKPIIDTFTPELIDDELQLTGKIINENGAEVTSVGFEYSSEQDFSSGVTSINSVIGNFTNSLDVSGFPLGTTYIRAWGVNSEGKGYGDIVSYTIEADYTNLSITGTSRLLDESPIENAQIALFDQLTFEFIESTVTNASGEYTFNNTNNFAPNKKHILICFKLGAEPLKSVIKIDVVFE